MSERAKTSLSGAYFERLYARDRDPWQFEDSEYERAKYAATLDALSLPSYARVLEIGCSIGVLTRALAERAGALLALDVAEAALAVARDRCADRPQVSFARMRVPDEWPDGCFDLILLSEVVYYLVPADVARLAARVRAALAPGGEILLVHFTEATDYPLSGDAAAELFIAVLADVLPVTRQLRFARYRLDRLGGAPARSSPPG